MMIDLIVNRISKMKEFDERCSLVDSIAIDRDDTVE